VQTDFHRDAIFFDSLQRVYITNFQVVTQHESLFVETLRYRTTFEKSLLRSHLFHRNVQVILILLTSYHSLANNKSCQ
jgi:hypothetical protein